MRMLQNRLSLQIKRKQLEVVKSLINKCIAVTFVGNLLEATKIW